MARAVRDAKLESPTARAKLGISYTPYWRAIDPGLHLGYRRGKNGGQWLSRWYRGDRKYHSEIIGVADDRQPADGVIAFNFTQAQKKVRENYAKASSPTPAAGPLTVRQACERYVEFLRAERKTADDAEQRLKKHVLPTLGHKTVAALTREEVEAVKRAMVKRDPEDPEIERRAKSSANRTFTSLKAALNRAFDDVANKIQTDNAWRRVKAYENVDGARGCFLDPAQSRRLINVSAGAFRNFVTSALLTGACPPHELAPLRVRDFHAQAGTLTVPEGKTGNRAVVLTDEAIEFFKGLTAGREPDALLLPKDDGTAWKKGHHIRPMRDAVKRAKLPADCTAYSLRHTHASQALLNGMNIKLLADNLGTSVAMIEKHYGKFLAASRRQLVEASGPKLGLEPGTVRKLSIAKPALHVAAADVAERRRGSKRA